MVERSFFGGPESLNDRSHVDEQEGSPSQTALLPTKALSIRQPWAWLIVNGHKDIENRDWPTRYRGPVLIHASKAWTWDEKSDGADVDRGIHLVTGHQCDWRGPAKYDLGGIVGVADIVDCVTRSASPWFVGRYGFVLANARPLPFMPLKGALGFFDAHYSPVGDAPDAQASAPAGKPSQALRTAKPLPTPSAVTK